jgi:hypothetical protein
VSSTGNLLKLTSGSLVEDTVGTFVTSYLLKLTSGSLVEDAVGTFLPSYLLNLTFGTGLRLSKVLNFFPHVTIPYPFLGKTSISDHDTA